MSRIVILLLSVAGIMSVIQFVTANMSPHTFRDGITDPSVYMSETMKRYINKLPRSIVEHDGPVMPRQMEAYALVHHRKSSAKTQAELDAHNQARFPGEWFPRGYDVQEEAPAYTASATLLWRSPRAEKMKVEREKRVWAEQYDDEDDMPHGRLLLNMLVKNEGAHLKRTLPLWAKMIDYWIIGVDDANTDDSINIIKQALGNLPGEIVTVHFDGIGPTWNQVVQMGVKHFPGATHGILADADYTPLSTKWKREELRLYNSVQLFGIWEETLTISRQLDWIYRNIPGARVTRRCHHTMLVPPLAGQSESEYSSEIHSLKLSDRVGGYGDRAGGKTRKYIRWLELDLLEYPNDGHTLYYLAHSHFDLIDAEPNVENLLYHAQAAYGNFSVRAGIQEGSSEGRFFSLIKMAEIQYRFMKNHEKSVEDYVRAIRVDPWRLDGYFYLAQRLRSEALDRQNANMHDPTSRLLYTDAKEILQPVVVDHPLEVPLRAWFMWLEVYDCVAMVEYAKILYFVPTQEVDSVTLRKTISQLEKCKCKGELLSAQNELTFIMKEKYSQKIHLTPEVEEIDLDDDEDEKEIQKNLREAKAKREQAKKNKPAATKPKPQSTSTSTATPAAAAKKKPSPPAKESAAKLGARPDVKSSTFEEPVDKVASKEKEEQKKKKKEPSLAETSSDSELIRKRGKKKEKDEMTIDSFRWTEEDLERPIRRRTRKQLRDRYYDDDEYDDDYDMPPRRRRSHKRRESRRGNGGNRRSSSRRRYEDEDDDYDDDRRPPRRRDDRRRNRRSRDNDDEEEEANKRRPSSRRPERRHDDEEDVDDRKGNDNKNRREQPQQPRRPAAESENRKEEKPLSREEPKDQPAKKPVVPERKRNWDDDKARREYEEMWGKEPHKDLQFDLNIDASETKQPKKEDDKKAKKQSAPAASSKIETKPKVNPEKAKTPLSRDEISSRKQRFDSLEGLQTFLLEFEHDFQAFDSSLMEELQDAQEEMRSGLQRMKNQARREQLAEESGSALNDKGDVLNCRAFRRFTGPILDFTSQNSAPIQELADHVRDQWTQRIEEIRRLC